MDKRAQAAMEFLMTYGWAILVVIAAVGALAYFGVLDADKYVPSKCDLPQIGVVCTDKKVTASGITVVLKNGMGSDLRGVDVSIQECGFTSLSADLNSGDIKSFNVPCSLSGSKYVGDINITYTLPADIGGQTHKVKGTIKSKIE